MEFQKYGPSVSPPSPNHAGILVRPDYATIPIALSLREIEPAQALPLLKNAIGLLTSRLASVSTAAHVVLRDASFSADVPAKSSGSETWTQLNGAIEVDLPEGDFWERAALLGAVVSLLRALIAEARREKRPITAAFRDPEALVRDPERFRAQLVHTWITRAREVTAAANEAAARPDIIDYPLPGPVTQHPISLEQVELRLDLAGRINVPAHPGPAQGATTVPLAGSAPGAP